MAVTDVGGAVLVLRALGLGDLLTGLPALRAVRRTFADRRLVLATPGGLAPFVALADTVDALLPTPALGKLHASGRPALAINLHGYGPESTKDLLGTRPRRLLTHRCRALPDISGLVWNSDLHEVDRWCRLVEYGGMVADRTDLRLQRPAIESRAPGAVIVHPGAGSPARQWPVQRYATVAERLYRLGHRVLITGTAAERPLAAAVAEQANLCSDAVVAGALGADELAALIADAALVICGDTGIGHLATAFGTRSVLLFGPTPPRLWGPPPTSRHTVLWAGNVGDPHAGRPDDGLLLLQPRQVIAAALGQLGQRESADVGA